jgi:hypothetical protein
MSAKKRQMEAKLTPKQRHAALLLVEREFTEDSERKTLDEIAEEVGISVRGLYKWRTQNKTFIDYVNCIADEFLESKRAVVYRQMMKLIEGQHPSVKAIDLYFKRHGLLTEKQIVETRDGNDGSSPEEIEKEIAELDELLKDSEVDE